MTLPSVSVLYSSQDVVIPEVSHNLARVLLWGFLRILWGATMKEETKQKQSLHLCHWKAA
jgi:hypothetical protein